MVGTYWFAFYVLNPKSQFPLTPVQSLVEGHVLFFFPAGIYQKPVLQIIVSY